MLIKLVQQLCIVVILGISTLSIAQEVNTIEVLNNYKAVILKPEDKHNEYNEAIEQEIINYLKASEFPKPLDSKHLLSNESSNCDILTLRYKVKNTSYSSVNLLAEIEFVDCEYRKVFQSSVRMNSSFYSKKAILKAVDKALADLNSYTYSYNPPIQKEAENSNQALLAETVIVHEGMDIPQEQYRGGIDPLKGLDVASAKQDIQLGNYYALIIGIDNYSNEWAALKNAVHDAQSISQLLQSNYVFDDVKTLLNEDATRNNIIGAFEELISKVNSNDNVFIYYSGHGEFNQSINKGFWVPVDAKSTSMSQYISNNDIQSFLSGIRSKHTLLVSDACFSGDIFRGKTMTIPYEDNYKYYYKVHSLPSRKAISSGGIEPVMDGGREGHSVFTYYFLKALSSNSKKYYDAGEIYERIKIPVVNNSEQTPYYRPIKNAGDEGGQFIFIQKNSDE